MRPYEIETMKNRQGFSLVELIIVMAIFSVVMAGLYAAYSVQLKQGVVQYRLAESEMELGITKNIIDRDLSMAGYGLQDDYDFDGDGTQNFTPRAVRAANADPDTLTLMGTALGLGSRAAQGWTFVASTAGAPAVPAFRLWNDAREDVGTNDRVILVDPNAKKLLAEGAGWLFQYNGSGSTPTLLSNNMAFSQSFPGVVVYGLNQSGMTDATQPYYAVTYYLADTVSSPPPATCAPGTRNLLRAESRTSASPTGGDPILNCVLDFQVAFGLDTNEDGQIEVWDNGGVTASTYATKDLNRRLKQIRAYVLVQEANRDPNYTHSPAVIRAGDLYLKGGAVGRDITLTADQLKYRWRVISFAITPRNIR